MNALLTPRTTLTTLHQAICSCNQCPRLREYCQKIASTRRRAYLSETYWGKPIPGFGDPEAELLIVGLAPGAHGANRTGRIFTGDRSGEWLYRALFKAGFSNQPESKGLQDGLSLKNTYITCIVKCAPPDNRPTPLEQVQCSRFLKQELAFLKQIRVRIALGQYAYDHLWRELRPNQKQPKFKHGLQISLHDEDNKSNEKNNNKQWLLLSYHPSQQNTFTGRLTEPMFDSVFQMARDLIG